MKPRAARLWLHFENDPFATVIFNAGVVVLAFGILAAVWSIVIDIRHPCLEYSKRRLIAVTKAGPLIVHPCLKR